MRPASAAGSLLPAVQRAVYKDLVLLLQKDSLLTAAQLKAKVREAWRPCRWWVGTDSGLVGSSSLAWVLTSWVGGWAGGAEL